MTQSTEFWEHLARSERPDTDTEAERTLERAAKEVTESTEEHRVVSILSYCVFTLAEWSE